MNPKKIKALAEKLGCTIKEDFEVIQMDAPPGKIFVATGTHYIDHYYNPGFKSDAWWCVEQDLKAGLEDCTDPFCEICHPCPVCGGMAYLPDNNYCPWCNDPGWILVNRYFWEKWKWPSRDFHD
ncbi:MAG: hypothetical protein QW835_00665 [Candidatus Hadarchaeum sp.]